MSSDLIMYPQKAVPARISVHAQIVNPSSLNRCFEKRYELGRYRAI
jgi:hypothetical protein